MITRSDQLVRGEVAAPVLECSGGANEADKQAAFATLDEVLVTFSRLLAPVLSFITGEIHAGLVPDAPSSVHHTDYPVVDEDTIEGDIERSMKVARTVVTLGRSLRSDHSIGVRQPLARLAVITRDPEAVAAVPRHGVVIADELNVEEVVTRDVELSVIELGAKANFRRLGSGLGAAVREVAAALAALPSEQVASLVGAGGMIIAGLDLSADDVVVTRNPRPVWRWRRTARCR